MADSLESGVTAVRVQSVGQHDRGAYFTPPTIAAFLANWAIRDQSCRVLDPTCGEAVFLLAAGRRLRQLGVDDVELDARVHGIDLHKPSLDSSLAHLEAEDLDAHLLARDIFEVPTPDQYGSPIPFMDAVIGNPPFVRYQSHRGDVRKRSAEAALRQGVRLTGLASSWASILVHSSGFLKPDGRLAMVLPAELLTVNYAEPIRQWLKSRFSGVTLVMFERLQFNDALEKVVLLLAHGNGGCDSFQLQYVQDASELQDLQFGDAVSVMPRFEGKWTDLLMPMNERRLYRDVVDRAFQPLQHYGTIALGTVTGSNEYFAIRESKRVEYGLTEKNLVRICPPGTRHLRGLSFTTGDWKRLLVSDERVWLLNPESGDRSRGLARYIAKGEEEGVSMAYKCQVRSPWWKPPVTPAPDLFFTYMSHRYPRLIANSSRSFFLNSMHGLSLHEKSNTTVRSALPLLMFNSVTMLGAEIEGRSYGGGILKLEPREASILPLPKDEELARAWVILKSERGALNRQLQSGLWTNVVAKVDDVLLRQVVGLSQSDVSTVHSAARNLRARRLSKGSESDVQPDE